MYWILIATTTLAAALTVGKVDPPVIDSLPTKSIGFLQRHLGLINLADCINAAADDYAHSSIKAVDFYTKWDPNLNKTQTSGYVGFDRQLNAIIVSATGLLRPEEMNAEPVKFDCEDCMVNSIYYKEYQKLVNVIDNDVKILQNKYPSSNRLILTGHHMGATLVSLLMVKLHDPQYTRLMVFTTGLPPIGNKKFVEFYNTLKFTGNVTYKTDREFFKLTNRNDYISNQLCQYEEPKGGEIRVIVELFHGELLLKAVDCEVDSCNNLTDGTPLAAVSLMYLTPLECNDVSRYWRLYVGVQEPHPPTSHDSIPLVDANDQNPILWQRLD